MNYQCDRYGGMQNRLKLVEQITMFAIRRGGTPDHA